MPFYNDYSSGSHRNGTKRVPRLKMAYSSSGPNSSSDTVHSVRKAMRNSEKNDKSKERFSELNVEISDSAYIRETQRNKAGKSSKKPSKVVSKKSSHALLSELANAEEEEASETFTSIKTQVNGHVHQKMHYQRSSPMCKTVKAKFKVASKSSSDDEGFSISAKDSTSSFSTREPETLSGSSSTTQPKYQVVTKPSRHYFGQPGDTTSITDTAATPINQQQPLASQANSNGALFCFCDNFRVKLGVKKHAKFTVVVDVNVSNDSIYKPFIPIPENRDG
ncbi:unnamed protein product [Bursaphelenchus okinawaensis]|uniref:Uncharacterized protein n=1 Tax=Bursaphelenchus okinawaensis TaxID=465554 RepID=A0A811JR48_9BILA|nr:unnamed protein product [Bursaphelenchus okinawaensis]CAG9079246.1 unnamed protein product [Bursaphelenchus okinawaensis]